MTNIFTKKRILEKINDSQKTLVSERFIYNHKQITNCYMIINTNNNIITIKMCTFSNTSTEVHLTYYFINQ